MIHHDNHDDCSMFSPSSYSSSYYAVVITYSDVMCLNFIW